MFPLDSARWVIDQFPVAAACREIVPLGNHGGFSGARLWRVEAIAGSFCLRAWPENGVTATSLSQIHRLMALARNKGLLFVPMVCPALAGQTWAESQGRLWDLTQWLPGRADFHKNPTADRLHAACIALAQLQRAWTPSPTPTGSCPALFRRLHRLRRWQDLLRGGWRPDFSSRPVMLSQPARRAGELLNRHLPTIPTRLNEWTDRPCTLQPCLCDIWHDHVLFEGNMVAGIIDYGSMKIDNVAVDLARLLGSMVGDDEELWRTGLAAYRDVRPLSSLDEDMAHLLDWSGTLLALANWLTWLYHEQRQFENAELVAQRLETILKRVENWGQERFPIRA